MFRVFVWCFIFLVLLAVAPLISANQGAAIITYAGTTYKTSLFTLLIVFLLALGAFEILAFVLRVLYRILFGWYVNRKERRQAKADRLVEKGMRQALSGDYRKAQKTLSKSATKADLPFYNLAQTFELAIKNRNVRLAKELLARCIESAQDNAKDQELLNVCKLKYFVADQQWDKASEFLAKVREKTNSEEVNLIARNIYIHTGQYGMLEDLLPYLEKQQYILPEQAKADYTWVYQGYIAKQLARSDKASDLANWFDLQTRAHRSSVAFRNEVLKTLLEKHAYYEAIDIAAETISRCKVAEVEGTIFFDLLEQIQQDTLDNKLCRRIEKYYRLYSEASQIRFMSVIAHLYYRRADYTKAQTWVDQLLTAQEKQGALHRPDDMLLAQVVYRKNNAEAKLVGLTDIIDNQYNNSYQPHTDTPEKLEDKEKDSAPQA
ncbi:heme biosynthesis HemY N-terminal domain-containing protein [Psittacicella hinzii]|uniref:HemY N-terminal domain-containing protein n=1 Tax=Psittacicella hinzii TaxID=2028575 RepID=A0A3A1YHH6_9GAMM|nr:heme biosynthesis HemY N-terminal domain-containing protein [Psittacicella hinzii]RIY37145.1 hypothetical protein CKF58_05165 [Psittacicella hinzii]